MKGSSKSPTKSSLQRAMTLVRNLIEGLNAAPKATTKEPKTRGLVFFLDVRRGGIAIAEPQATLYRDCIERLSEVHGSRPEERAMSRDAVEQLLRSTILRVLRPRRKTPDETRRIFAGRLARELKRLEKALVELPQSWQVVAQVHGLGPEGLPFDFGGVRFEGGTVMASRVAARIGQYEPGRRVDRAAIEKEEEVRRRSRKEIVDALSEAAIGHTTVRAVDAKAAKMLGIERIRRTVDVLNFFAPLLAERPGLLYRAYLSPDGPQTHLLFAAFPEQGSGLHWSERHPGEERRVQVPDLTSTVAIELGMPRASKMLAKFPKNALEKRVTNALSWAGRARVEPRRDQAFLNYIVALESVLTTSRRSSGVTERLKRRLADLIGSGAKGKRKVYELFAQMYAIRGSIAHEGDAGELTDRDLETVSKFVEYALITLLAAPELSQMQTAEELERWFDDQFFA